MKTRENTKQKKVGFIQQMVDDKKAVRNYIQTHGTLKGFQNEGIKFAKPF